MIKNIVFDFGGVIFDLAYEQAVEAFPRIGLTDADQRLDRYHQRGMFEELESGRISMDAFRAQLGQLCHHELSHEEVLGAWLGYVGGPVDLRRLDAIDALRRRGYHTYLLSNTNPFVQSWAESADFCAYHRPLSSYMDKCYTSYEVGIMKPNEGIFRHMLEDSALQPSETLFLDDSMANVEAADRLGIQTLLVEKNGDWRSAVKERLRMS